jgi:hypothetical protein
MRKLLLVLVAVSSLAACASTSVLTRAQREELAQQFDDGRVSQTDIEKFLADHRSHKAAQVEAITPPPAAKVDQPLPSDTYRVSVECDLPVAIAAGKYDRVNDNITPANFPQACKTGDVEVTLVTIERDMTTEEVVAELSKRGFRPATLPELLALGAAQPDLKQQFNFMVALGSRWLNSDSDVSVPILVWNGSYRNLDLYWVVNPRCCRWVSGVWFAAVRK